MTHSKHQHLREKIIRAHEHEELLRKRVHYLRFTGQRMVFTNGCFDILHAGHVDYLSRAADLGDVLIVGLNTDDSVRRLKGDDRPVNPEEARANVLAALSFVDLVVLFDEDTPTELIKKVKPDVLVKGQDYQPENIAGADIVKENQGKVVTIPLLQGFSTSSLINRIYSLKKK